MVQPYPPRSSTPPLLCGCGICLKAADCVEISFESFPLLLSLNKQLQLTLPSAAKSQGHAHRKASPDKWGTDHLHHQKSLHIYNQIRFFFLVAEDTVLMRLLSLMCDGTLI